MRGGNCGRRPRAWLATAVAVLSTWTVSGCGTACETVGDVSGLQLTLPVEVGRMPNLAFDFCLDDQCGSAARFDASAVSNPVGVDVPFEDDSEVELRITVTSDSGRVLATGSGRVAPTLVPKVHCTGFGSLFPEADRFLVVATLHASALTQTNS